MNDYKTIRKIAEIEEYIGSAGVVSFDFETSPTEKYRSDGKAALDAHKADITGVSLSVKAGTGRYIPLRHRVGKNASIPSVMAFLRQRVFQNPKTVKIAHNMAFEAMFLYKDGIVLQEPVYDTIVASQLTLKNDFEYRDLGDSGLKTLVPYLYGVELPKFEDVVGEHSFDELDPDAWDTCRYACADSDWALQLYYTFSEWFENNIPKHRLICEKIESPTAVFTGMMKYNGVLFDTDLMEEKKAEAEAHLVDLRAKLQAVIGNVDIGENCGTQAFKDYLYKTENLPVLKTTTKYAEAADDEAMQLLRAYCKKHRPEMVSFFDTVQEFRKWAKIKSTYIDGYLKWINPATGRIHPDLLPMGTDTGRFASRRPNLQNMPRKGSDPIGVRQFVVAPEGTSFLDFDFSQIELRVGAFYCRDPRMMETYRSGGDIHASTTSVIFGISVDEAQDKDDPDYKERRTIAKNVNFGTFYGLFPRGLQRTLKFKAGLEKTEDQCARIIANLKTGYGALPKTITATTGSGGKHYIFKYTEELALKNVVGFRDGLDVRTQGGLIVAAPSMHQSGNRYAWDTGLSPFECEAAEMPSWLVDEIRKVGTKLTQKKKAADKQPRKKIKEGGRNNHLASLAGALRRKGIGEDGIIATLRAENKERLDPPLDDETVVAIAKSTKANSPMTDGRSSHGAGRRKRRSCGTAKAKVRWRSRSA